MRKLHNMVVYITICNEGVNAAIMTDAVIVAILRLSEEEFL
jgi:hypothetical protein